MKLVELVQGSTEWHAHRANHYNASDAPAMMGVSPYKTRDAFIAERATGITAEPSEYAHRLFADGHASESAARPIVERRLGVELFPATGVRIVDGMPLSASFDGLPMLDHSLVWENKLLTDALADQIASGELAEHYVYQLEHQLLVSGAERVVFTASNGTDDGTHELIYRSDPAKRARLIAGWKQYAVDVAEYVPTPPVTPAVPASITGLPALFVQVEGKVIASNLDAFQSAAETFIASIKTDLQTDQDFADAESMAKFLKDGEDKLALVKQQALSQTASIDELFRTVDAISEQMRAKRLALAKLVASEKDARKTELVVSASARLSDHIAALNARVGVNAIPNPGTAPFASAIKGLRTIASITSSLNAALASAKITASETADRIDANRKQMQVSGVDYSYLVPDFAVVCTKSSDDFSALVATRIQRDAERKQAEKAAAEKAAAVKEPCSSPKPTPITDGVQLHPCPPERPLPHHIDQMIDQFLDDLSADVSPTEFELNRIRLVLVLYEQFRARAQWTRLGDAL